MYDKRISEKRGDIISHILGKYFGAVTLIKNRFLSSMLILFLLFPISFLGCGGGGGGGDDNTPPPPSQSIQLFPSSYDFGTITPGIESLPLEVKISNNGSTLLTLKDITLSDTDNYKLDLDGGSSPCGSASSTIAVGDECTLEIDFTPTDFGIFSATLTIESDDSVALTIDLDLAGANDDGISELNVIINQVVFKCPENEVTAYVSVTDQGGYPVTTLTADNFSVTEGIADPVVPTNVTFVSDGLAVPISVVLLMDYSGSITEYEDAQKDMEESLKTFIDEMGNDDETEIIKFDDIWEVVQPFTSDKDVLKAVIDTPWDNGEDTVLYDAVYKALQDLETTDNVRKAVIVITDGTDSDSTLGIADVIDLGKDSGVPIFAIGLGNLDEEVLEQMADDTGGKYYQALTSDNLKTIYNQLASILYYDQYVLTYTSEEAGTTADLLIEATLNDAEGNDTKEITTCP